MKKFNFQHYRIVVIALLILGSFQTAKAQPAVQAFFGKAFSDVDKKPAIRVGMGVNNVLFNRVGFYYTYEFRGPNMPFENDVFTDNYRRDILGGTIKIDPNFSIYGGLGAFKQGLAQSLSFRGLRKEIGVQYTTTQIWSHANVFAQVGYSFTIRLTTNFGVQIPLNYEKRSLNERIKDN